MHRLIYLRRKTSYNKNKHAKTMNRWVLGVLFYGDFQIRYILILNEFAMKLRTSFPGMLFFFFFSLEYIFRQAIEMQKSDHLLVSAFQS